jgi:hypothetical protein
VRDNAADFLSAAGTAAADLPNRKDKRIEFTQLQNARMLGQDAMSPDTGTQ